MILALVCGLMIPASGASAGGWDRAVDMLLPRVVKLYGLGTGEQVGYGTGVLVSGDGLVLTVNSLLIDARHIRVVTSDGTIHEAELVRRDRERQVALLRIKAVGTGRAGDFPHFDLRCGSAEGEAYPEPRPGDWLVIGGNPFKVAEGAEAVTLSHGVLSARTRMDARRNVKEFPYRGDVLVLDAVTSNPGHPGSAVVDLEGRFVGMVGREVVSNLTRTHFNYAMPRDVLCEFLGAGEAGSARPDGTGEAAGPAAAARAVDPGIRLLRTRYQKLPPLVERVRRGSPAEGAGVRQDDLILSVNGISIGDGEEYDRRLNELHADQPIDLVIRRGRTIVSVRIEAEKSP